jgi:hypothetical protein
MWKISLIAAAAMAWGHVAAAQTVAIESNRPVTLAKSNGGSSGVWGANALTLLGNVEDLCMAPCETSIDPGLTTLVAYGKGLASVVEKVDLKADTSYDLKVHTSPRWQRMAGPFGMVWGGLTALTGGLVVSRTDLGIPFLAAGGAIFAGGTALTVTGKRKMTVTVR